MLRIAQMKPEIGVSHSPVGQVKDNSGEDGSQKDWKRKYPWEQPAGDGWARFHEIGRLSVKKANTCDERHRKHEKSLLQYRWAGEGRDASYLASNEAAPGVLRAKLD